MTPDRRVRLPEMVAARVCSSAVFMTYPACLITLIDAWDMTATQAGWVQGAFSIGFAVSLLTTSILSDRLGAPRVYLWSTVLTGCAALAFALLADSFETALVLNALHGLAQGGTYTPAIMLVSAGRPAGRRGAAVGWILGGMSLGYVISIFLSVGMIEHAGYQAAFLSTALIACAAVPLGLLGLRGEPAEPAAEAEHGAAAPTGDRRQTVLLTTGYVGHCWELFGAWAWIPAFLVARIAVPEVMSAVALGLMIALALHLTGFFSSSMAGYAADRFGSRAALVFFAVAGTLCSLAIGWIPDTAPYLILAAAAVYGAAIIGDSPVLSSAMVGSVEPSRLGRALGVRSILGIGAGALAPVAFGWILDTAPAATAWPLAFTALAAGGGIAVVSALLLSRSAA